MPSSFAWPHLNGLSPEEWLKRQQPRPIEEYLRLIEAAADNEQAAAASGSSAEDQTSTRETDPSRPIQAMKIGDRVPVVFARRRTGGTGGVMVQPKATEALFANTATTITAAYHCVLGEGLIGSVQVRDMRIGLTRQGSFSQNYGQRAGTWRPGNITTANVPYDLPNFPTQCGIGGDYKGVSTIEYSITCPANSDKWKLPLNVFIRQGMQIDRGRLVDDVVGPSDNLCDLVIWALVRSGRKKESEINLVEMEKTANFLEANSLFCNGQFSTGATLPDFLSNILPAFLLRETTIDGKYCLIPALPVNADGTINVDPIEPEFILTEEVIAPGSLEIRPATAASRGLLEITVLWRQQTSDVEPPLDRDLVVAEAGTGTVPVSEEFDLRGFCTSEPHAAMAGGYRHALRTLAGDTASLRLLAGDHSGWLRQGQIVQVFLGLVSEREPIGNLNGLWFIDRIDLSEDGGEALQLSSCPVDGEGRSLVALRVLEARDAAPGWILPYPPLAEPLADEPGRESNTSVPASSTSGIPFSAGGGGVTPPPIGTPGRRKGGPNRAEMPPRQKKDRPNEPGTTATVVRAGGPPRNEYGRRGEGRPINWGGVGGNGEGTIYTEPGPWDCEYGISVVRTRVKGLGFGQGGLAFGYVNGVIESISWIKSDLVEQFLAHDWAEENGGFSPLVEKYEITYTRYGYDYVIAETIYSCGEPAFGPNGIFSMEILDWRCKLADGSPGPVETP